MKIKKILSRNRRDFYAIYVCEHCNYECKMSGYDDTYFHKNVIPNFICDECGKKANDCYIPVTTKYPDWCQI